mmetsp:Transcript_50007/g.143973  ORF Transcript_50007/g.143973 Transcript_50007/m.143973 type:complete len:384 (+) Transcript_50007:174-1325(+)
MNAWAKDGQYDCHFLCICVLGDQSAYNLAREMSKQMKLTHCVNGFIDNEQDMPTYGQLGCRGFIVLDAEHRLVSPGTSAFMEVRGLAFDHVEALLSAVCSGRPTPRVCPGEYVILDTPPEQRPDLKGLHGMCLKVDGSSMQFGFVDGPLRGRAMVLPLSSVSPAAAEVDETGCGPGGCGPCGSGGCADGSCAQGGCAPSGCADGKCAPGGGRCAPGGCAEGGAGGCDQKGSCSGGGCDGARGCDGSGSCLDPAVVEQALTLVSVQVPSMDAEHAECAAALRNLVSQRTHAALEVVRQCLAEHFEHEEALFVEFGFGAHANEKLSAAKSHAEEHKRILAKIQRGLQSQAAVPGDFILDLLQDFHDHTLRHDSQYAEPLSAKGAK